MALQPLRPRSRVRGQLRGGQRRDRMLHREIVRTPVPIPSSAAANDAVAVEARDFAALDLVFPDRARPAGHALADLVLQLLVDQAERGGAAVAQQGSGLDRVCLVGRFDLEELAAVLVTFFD